MTGRSKLKSLLGNRQAAARLAIVLLVMVATILIGKEWEDVHIESLRDDCSSLFQDRLVPAATLFKLNDEFHSKRATLDDYLDGQTNESEKPIDYRLGQHDAAISAGLKEIEGTYLVAEESRRLGELRTRFSEYMQLESEYLGRHRKGEEVSYDPTMREAFLRVHEELLGLIKVQEEVGLQLNQHSVASAARVTTLLHLQLSVTFILGIIGCALAMGLTPVRPKPTRSDKMIH